MEAFIIIHGHKNVNINNKKFVHKLLFYTLIYLYIYIFLQKYKYAYILSLL